MSATQPAPAQQQPQSPPAQLGKVASASSMDGMAMGSSNGNGSNNGTNGNEVGDRRGGGMPTSAGN